jgi:hypothetical protein
MENVTRYTCGAGDGMFESKEGYYVDYTDYKVLLDKYNQALSQHDVIKNEVAVCECKDEWLKQIRLNVMRCKKCGTEY